MENVTARLRQFCFVLAGVTALAGMSLGLYYRTHENALGRLALFQISHGDGR
jgi:1,4-dihydroxy-2-naphthoyl-CoA synthase